MRPSPKTVPGTGLSPLPYILLVTFSVVLFLYWGGPLWAAQRETSHVMRFLVSYAAVIPAAAGLLLLARRFTWSHLTAATASTWAIKLMFTSTVYLAIARGTALIPVPAPLPQSSSTQTGTTYEYHAVKGEFANGTVKGAVVLKDTPASGAVVLIDKPLPGAELADAAGPLHLWVGGSRYSEMIYLGQVGQDLDIDNKDPLLHTLHLYDRGRTAHNVPVPAGEKPRSLQMPEPGVYEMRCDTHVTERAAMVIVDHPYIVRADVGGQFTLNHVPVGPVNLVVVFRSSEKETTTLVRRVSARVEASETTVVHIDLSTPEVAEERL